MTGRDRPDAQTRIGPWVRWTVGPFAVVAALVYPFLQEGAEGRRLLVTVALETLFVCAALVTISPTRFAWAGRVIAALVATAYVLYLVDMLRTRPDSFWPPSRRSAATGFNAALGLLVFGYPGLKYALLGRFSWAPPDPWPVGETVRIVGLPDLGSAPEETRAAFQAALGQTFRVSDVGPYGHFEIELGPELDAELDGVGITIWIEPEHVEFVPELD